MVIASGPAMAVIPEPSGFLRTQGMILLFLLKAGRIVIELIKKRGRHHVFPFRHLIIF